MKTNGFAAVMSYRDGDTWLVPLSFGRKLKPNFGLGSQEQIPDWYINEKEGTKSTTDNREREEEGQVQMYGPLIFSECG